MESAGGWGVVPLKGMPSLSVPQTVKTAPCPLPCAYRPPVPAAKPQTIPVTVYILKWHESSVMQPRKALGGICIRVARRRALARAQDVSKDAA